MAVVDQLYTNCLAQAAYFVRSEGEAVVIDPLRDPHPYLELATRHNVKIKYVIETHFHADFVSGHIDLAKQSDATIVYGPTAEPHFDAMIARDGEVLRFGKSTLTVLHTPGHTPESSSFVLRNDGSDDPIAIFTGDTLFIGDVGRPDLVQLVATTTQEKQARILFHSLRDKIMPLPDNVIVYPGHGAGSACGKNMSSETTDLLGHQKLTNYALRHDMTEDEFVVALLEGLRDPPQYFGHQVELNKGAAGSFDEAVARGHRELSPAEVKAYLAEGMLAIDTRNSQVAFAEAHVPGSVYAGTSGGLAVWLASALPNVRQPYVLCNDGPDFEEGLSRLTRVGYDGCVGHLKGGIEAWIASGEAPAKIDYISPAELASRDPATFKVVDVRGPGEYRNAHFSTASNAPLCSRVPLDFNSLIDPSVMTCVYCAAGYRALMFISLCLRAGVKGQVLNIKGGFTEIQKEPALKSFIEVRAH